MPISSREYVEHLAAARFAVESGSLEAELIDAVLDIACARLGFDLDGVRFDVAQAEAARVVGPALHRCETAEPSANGRRTA